MSGAWQTDRNYTIPASLVRKGTNVIAVRVMDTGGGGGLYGKKGSMKLTVSSSKQTALDIEGEWKYQPVAELSGGKFYIFDVVKNDYFAQKRPVSIGPNSPSSLFNAMVNPVKDYKIRGAIWYQGEANVGRSDQYAKIFPLMIRNWRDTWKEGDFPFYFVQIAPYIYSGLDSTELAPLREAQTKALELPKTGMVVTLDIATVMNIHPPFKKEVGERLADLALLNDYGKEVPVPGPIFKTMTKEGRILKLQFDFAKGGLMAKGNKLNEFEIAGKDLKFVKASAKIVKNEVWVESPKVPDPESVRYCWRNGSVASLFSIEGQPAQQFRAKIK
jgi:sialate O-acetylesterase